MTRPVRQFERDRPGSGRLVGEFRDRSQFPRQSPL
jgi:hypothetical protein